MYTLKLNIGSWTAPVLGGGYILANPIMDGVTISKNRDSEFRQVVRTRIKGEFIFYNIPRSNQEFDKLKSLHDSGNNFVDAKIYYNGSERLTGLINLNTGTWDENKGQCSILFNENDDYVSLFQEKATNFNIKDASIESIKLGFHSQLFYIDSPCTSKSVADFQKNTTPDMIGSSASRVDEWDLYTLTNTTACSGGNIYTFVTNVIPFETGTYKKNIYIENNAVSQGANHWTGTYASNNNTVTELVEWVEFTEFVKLYDIIELMINTIDSSLTISESTYCTYFTVDLPEYNYVMIADKSDVKNYAASNPALYENISFARLMLLLKSIFNLEWTIDSGTFKLRRPESLSLPSFTTYPNHDFTTILYDNSSITDNQKVYRFLEDFKFYKEKWTFEDSFYAGITFIGGVTYNKENDFISEQIDYNSLDLNDGDYSLIEINNDVEYLRSNPEDANDTGMVFVSTLSTALGRTISYDFDNTKEYYRHPTVVNNLMKASYLVRTHHLTDRPYNSGVIDLVTTSLTNRPDKEVNVSNVPAYDIDDINFGYLVKTEVGNVVPESFEVDLSLNSFSKFKGVF
jgi:hypothetical protein